MNQKDTEQSIKKRVEDLLKNMTLEQKIAQMQCTMLIADPAEELKVFNDSLGEVTVFGGGRSIEGNVDMANKIQEEMLAKNNLGIPTLMHAEALTGLNSAGATIYPSAIGLGATWNMDTVEKMAELIRKQMVAIGVRQALSPVMDVCRDPRWGRIGETYGEDPTHCAAMSVAFTKGLQGESLKDGVVATGKHFLGYANGEGGLNMSSNPIPPRELREVYAKPFQAAITEAGLESMMNSYGTIDGDFIIKSKHILTDLLHDEMGFDGIVVSDYMSMDRAVDLKVSENPLIAGIEAITAGLDIELPKPYSYTMDMVNAVKEGKLDEPLIDRAVRRILTTKCKLGIIDTPYTDKNLLQEAYETPAPMEHSLKAARESIVLVKNDGVLPLNKEIKKIAVIGPHADSIRLLFGCYTYPATLDMMISGSMKDMAGMSDSDDASDNKQEGDAAQYYEGCNIRVDNPMVDGILQKAFGPITPTILASIKAKCPDAEIIYERGCDVAGTNRQGFDSSLAAAKAADVVILTLGGKYGWGNNCTIGEGIDSDTIGLPGVQEELAKLIFETGTPSIMVHMDARPLSSEYISKNYPAIIENWFPGSTGGQALADVLFGDYNPAGRLPVTVARNAGQIPIYATHKKGNSYAKAKGMILNKYVEGSKLPLHYFGEGHSYTSFSYSDLRLDKTVKAEGEINLSCDITNVGARDGEEVVQVYVTDDLASMLRPNMELAGFKRVFIEAGKTKRVTFTMRADQFAFLDKDMKWVVEAGTMTVKVGSSSNTIHLTDSFEIENTAYIDGKKRGFFAKTRVDA